MIKKISLLGSTGSIGCNVLQIVRRFPGRFQIVGLAAGKNIQLLRDQIEAFNPLVVSVADEALVQELSRLLGPEWRGKITSGQQGNIEVGTIKEADTVVSAIVGAAGLAPTYAAIVAGKNIALANKETLVMAGDLVMKAVQRHKVKLLPIDSEHNAIFQALAAGRESDVHKIILTASGGPFRQKKINDLWQITPEQALAHPNWNMGRKISIDSATLINKGLEIIEARWLFDIPIENIEVLIHPQSIVHSMVEFRDGSVIAQMGIPDMKTAIAYALSYPERLKLNLPRLNLDCCHDLRFTVPDFANFPALKLAYQVCKKGGTLPAIFNGANEIAVEAFLEGKIRFPEISLIVAETVTRLESREALNIKMVFEADLAARVQAESIVSAFTMKKHQQRGEKIACPEVPAAAAIDIPLPGQK